jgi:hypothetical protein
MELRDPEIRQQLKEGLERRIAGRPHSMVIDEMGIGVDDENGHRPVRVDVAVVTPKMLIGYEIKSDFDSLVRLERQIIEYDRVFDQCYLVCGNKYVEKALKLLPDHWGLTTLAAMRVQQRSGQSGDNYKLKFTTVRPAQQNPNASRLALAELLWRAEVWDELKLRGIGRGMSAAKLMELQAHLAISLTHEQLRATVARRLSLRTGWR